MKVSQCWSEVRRSADGASELKLEMFVQLPVHASYEIGRKRQLYDRFMSSPSRVILCKKLCMYVTHELKPRRDHEETTTDRSIERSMGGLKRQ